MTRLPDRPLSAALLALGLAAVLSAVADDDPATVGAAGAAATPPATTAGGTYADGTYEARGAYRSPAGRETVAVSLTVAGDRVTGVEVTPGARDRTSKLFQGDFADGIAKVVVGRPLDGLEVDVVSGSSLTSGGFNRAVARIRKEAAA